jgi:RHS repeat-associated protein
VAFFTKLWSPTTTQAEQLGYAYVYDEQGSLIAEVGSGGTNSSGEAQYIYLPTANGPMPIVAVVNGTTYAVHSDHLNTPRKLTDATGQAVWQWGYSAFGEDKPTLAKNRFANLEVTPNPGTTNIAEVKFNLRYPGQYADEESGLFYNYFRSYDARLGRYSQPDPIGLDGGWNRFGYVDANPLGFTDPEGLRNLRQATPGGNAYNRRQWERHGPGSIQTPQSNLPRSAAYEAGANMTQTPNPAYPGAPLDLPCVQWDCSSGSVCRPNDIKSSTDFLPPARSTADAPAGCRCISAGRDPAFQLPYDPSIDPYSNAKDVKDNWRSGTRLLRR